ncbi:ABC transporter permease [Granulicoccus sp. GXG6511]|uniref:ABC transporter permease n=1 Tax=Granulicoccus sp. GXG6511 TaxID=3381351 RepID=UPI003D7CAB48
MSTATDTRTRVATSGRGVRPKASFWQAAVVVARRELAVKLTSKSFVITTAITLLLLLAAMVVGPRLADAFNSPDTVAVTAQTEQAVTALGDAVEPRLVADAGAARQSVLDGEVDAAVVPSADSPTGLLVLAESDAPTALVQGLSQSPAVELLDPNAPNPLLVYFIGLAFGLVFLMTAMTFGMTIAQSVVEEKQTRIVEILLAAIPARAILAGKVVGNSLLAFGQVVLYAAVALIGMQVNSQRLNLDGLGIPILWFVMLFTIGFVMIASLYAAAAALVSRQEDLAQVSSPIMMLVMLPYFAILMFSNNPLALTIMSYFPFSAPVAVPMRVYLGQATLWENLLSVGILAASTAVVIWFAARIYERSILKTGQAVKWSQALKK